MMVPVKPRLRGGSNSSVLRLVGVFLLLISSMIAVSSATSLSPVQAANLTISATSPTMWDPPWAQDTFTISGTTVTGGIESIRIKSAGSMGNHYTAPQTWGGCPGWLTVTLGSATPACYVSGTNIIIRYAPPGGVIAANTPFSVTVAAGSAAPSEPDLFRDITVETYASADGSGNTVDSGTTRLMWPETVFFNPNGGTPTAYSQSSTGPAALMQNAFTRVGFTFGGWNAGGVVYADEADFPFDGSVANLSARWLATVTFDGNGADGGDMDPQILSSHTPLTLNAFTKTASTFQGWSGPNGTFYADGAGYFNDGSVTLTAVWQAQQAQTYTVTFDSNLGTGTMPKQTASTTEQLYPNGFTRTGYRFLGWDADQNASSPSYSPSDSYDFSANITLYAIWEQDTPTNPPSGNLNPPSGNTNTGVVVVPDTTTTTTEPAPVGVGESDLITEELQEQLTAPAGDAKMLIGGELVDVELTQAPSELRATAPAERTAAEVSELQTLATTMVAELQAVLGANATLPISVRNTPTGAVIVGLARNPITDKPMDVPVEDVVLVSGGALVLMASGVDGEQTAKIGLDGTLEIPEGGHVSVIASGLTPGVEGEVIVMSTPQLISSFAVGTSGEVAEQAALPTDLPLGDHTVVVTVGDEAASLGFRLVAATTPAEATGTGNTATLPATGSNGIAGSWALLFAALGALALLVSTRRRFA